MEKNIGKNKSSGAKKVERVEKETAEQVDAKKPAPKKPERKTAPKRAKANETRVKAEKKAADSRVKAARARSEKKEKKMQKRAEVKAKRIEKRAEIKRKRLEKKQAIAEKKLERKEKRAEAKAKRIEKKQARRAALKEKRVERRAEHLARRELLKNETKAEKQKRIAREKKEKLALRAKRHESREKARAEKRKAREAAHARKAADKKHRREQRTERKNRGIGGWLAAVISLGVACLALATVVTAGAVRMNDMTVASENGYRSTLYEMVSACEELDDSLGKLRISSAGNDQRTLLTNVIVDSALMESMLERVPVDQATSTDISGFVNRAGSYARQLLAKVSAGGTLSETERNTVNYLYTVNDKLYDELNNLVTTMSEKQLKEFLGGKQGTVSDKFAELGQGTKAEPEETVDAPFSNEGNVGENALAKYEEISSAQAEAAAKQYFAAYHVKECKYTGETLAADVSCYNFVLIDENDVEIFAEITKNGGKLAFFDTYEECSTKNFDLETCDAIAREYLASIGIDNVEAVWLSDGGMVANLTYTTVKSGARIYPELIRIRVCEEKGRVIGMDARSYLMNSADRVIKAGISENAARDRLADGLEPYTVHLALIPVNGQETLCYEYGCNYGDQEYIVYLDANSGEEVQIFRVRESAKGSYLR